jgi:N-acetylglucosamine transport system permease protein
MNPKLAAALRQVPAYLILGLWTAFVLVMVFWVIAASLSTTREIFTRTLLSSGLHWDNYATVFGEGGMARYLFNTLAYVAV